MARKSLAELLGGVTRFGRLVVTGAAYISGPDGRMRRAATCRCDCGKEFTTLVQSLKSGRTQSCGCLASERRSESAARLGAPNRRHGLSGSPEWNSWHAMRCRCLCLSDKAFVRYGGRGIGIVPEWDEFEAFLADMGKRPTAKHTLERLNNSKGYGPDNCAWRTSTAQNRNRRNTLVFEFRGRMMPLGEVAESSGVEYGLLWRRVVRLGWNIERAVTEPSRKA